jgi:hypothetical protein
LISLFFSEDQNKNRSSGASGVLDRQIPVGTIKGQLKLSIEYRKDVLHVMICHAKDLAIPDGSKDEPNSYVKVYLRPDPHKATKRKTRVVRKNRHPSFMEMVSSRGMYILYNELNKVVVFSVLNTQNMGANQTSFITVKMEYG